ncbi:MAG: diadenylate cyclase [Proteobacteria bacterium]|nr:diadenylate cyclase [Pseudomonadota bacterium]
MYNYFSFFSTIGWQDVVDIILNSYILFRFYILFRGTNVFRVLIVIAFLWFFQRIAFSLELIITSWALQGITAVAALIIIVVFRNEIRTVLQAKNLKSFLWGFPQKTSITPVEIISESAFELANKRIGALLVFPAKDDLEEYVKGGLSWRGVISKEMIMSIFWPNNPVHDGAAILRKDRVAEVSCILPLSHKNNLPSHYGTRHRAALGLAEATDAMVIAVSEERGTVSVAKDSGIHRVNRKKDLERMLMEHMGDAPKPDNDKRKEKLEIFFAALVSFLFIVGVWFSFSRGLEALINIEVPVEYMNRDSELEIMDTSANSVILNMGGSDSLIKSIRPEQLKVRIDLAKAAAGKSSYLLTDKNVTLPPGIVLKKINPSAIKVTLGASAIKELPVKVVWAGKLPSNLMLDNVKIIPDKVKVVGVRRTLDGIKTANTYKVYLNNINESGATTVKLALSPPSLKIAPGSNDMVTVEYTVKTK